MLISIKIRQRASGIGILAIEPAIVIARARTGIRSGKIRKKSLIIGRPGGLL